MFAFASFKAHLLQILANCFVGSVPVVKRFDKYEGLNPVLFRVFYTSYIMLIMDSLLSSVDCFKCKF